MKQKTGTAQGKAVPVLSYRFCFGITAAPLKKQSCQPLCRPLSQKAGKNYLHKSRTEGAPIGIEPPGTEHIIAQNVSRVNTNEFKYSLEYLQF